LTVLAYALKITFMARRPLQSQYPRAAANVAALAVLLVFAVRCSDAPLTIPQNKVVLTELFSTTE
jgi:hypothetical protein